ncbi:MAG: YtxH domain-containing protein [Clostridiaceae bacterium]|nr:YtxH domain-containing protein [Clostridiaceae bacterium]
MGNGFTKGVIIGGLIVASISLAMNNNLMSTRGRKRMMKSGKRLLKRTGNMVSDITGVFR